MKYIILLIVMISISGCTKPPLAAENPICKNLFKVAYGTAQAISVGLQCQNPSVIAADISDQIVKLNLCRPRAYSISLSNTICLQVSSIVAGLSVSSIPTTWGCSTQVVTNLIQSKVNESCVKLIK
jgi:hypothetical protein